MIDPRRIEVLHDGMPGKGPVVYWMSRDQRAEDNWALLHARALAVERRVPLQVVFCLVGGFLGATRRQYGFMLRGLRETADALAAKRIAFACLVGEPAEELPRFVHRLDAAALVTDFDPLRVKRRWREAVGEAVRVPFHEVDAHNIVPCRFVSDKCEFAAHTLRPKIHRLLPEFLVPIPALRKHPVPPAGRGRAVDWGALSRRIDADEGVGEVDWIEPGSIAGRRATKRFAEGRLAEYDTLRNDPNADGQSDLSPYLHFGQVSAQRVALECRRDDVPARSRDALLEELIVRRELSDNFCLYQAHYDGVAGFHGWARKTLDEHRGDPREYLYGRERFESAGTHDDLWNAAQLEMVKRGKMHGYLRMYWAKKILEWTESPEQALAYAVALNDRYELDGRDPNGYVGCAWSIGGVHDRAWTERPVFGKIRYMNANGCRRKFDVAAYVRRVADL